MRQKALIVAILCVGVAIVLTAGYFSGMLDAVVMSEGEKLAEKAFVSTAHDGNVSNVYYMQYTSRYNILSVEQWGDKSTFHMSIPDSGYVYIFDPPQSQFDGLTVAFLDSAGNVKLVLSYDEEWKKGQSYNLMLSSSVLIATQHISNANDIAKMYYEAYSAKVDGYLGKSGESDVWLMLSEKQVERLNTK